MRTPRPRLLSLFASVISFSASLVAVSNLMPLLLGLATDKGGRADIVLVLANLAVVCAGIFVLGRQLYALDKHAGRIRNRIGVFE